VRDSYRGRGQSPTRRARPEHHSRRCSSAVDVAAAAGAVVSKSPLLFQVTETIA